MSSIVSYTEARANLKRICDQVTDDCDSVTIHRRDSENVVVMSESEFNGWKETVYLMSNPNNANRLMASIAQAEKGMVCERKLIED